MKDDPQEDRRPIEPIPKDLTEALSWVKEIIVESDEGRLQDVPLDTFRRGWFAIGFLYPGLHPDSALEHGDLISSKIVECSHKVAEEEPRLIAPFYVESGWPILLAPIVTEARRRYESETLADEEFYCVEAAMAGMQFGGRLR